MGYLHATRHPWPSLLFLLPLIVIYEGGVIWIGGEDDYSLRNGADAWLRWFLDHFGVEQSWVPPLALVAMMLFWSAWRWDSRPKDGLGLWTGMAIESISFALILWAISRNFGTILDHFGVVLNVGDGSEMSQFRQVVSYVGAGIYEELLFRLILFGGLVWFLRLLFIPNMLAVPVGIAVSSFLFAAAHHIGETGEKIDHYVFAFRAMAGVYFALLFHFRGFGVAVGAHAGYDVIVGVNWG